jgi:hypothetical protein
MTMCMTKTMHVKKLRLFCGGCGEDPKTNNLQAEQIQKTLLGNQKMTTLINLYQSCSVLMCLPVATQTKDMCSIDLHAVDLVQCKFHTETQVTTANTIRNLGTVPVD